ncbi:MAG: hypothetical protein ABSD02_18745 [Steroidobacteraceae bacterium]|jgi:hypothetical protein
MIDPRGLRAALILSLSLAGCAGLELNPLINEHRAIRAETDRARTLVVSHELVLDDKRHPAHEFHLPGGIYALEGEDEEYWYLRSSSALTLLDFHRGAQTERHSLRGGIALGKYSTRSVPAAVYIDGEGTAKVLVWKLGKDFMGGENRDWRRSF